MSSYKPSDSSFKNTGPKGNFRAGGLNKDKSDQISAGQKLAKEAMSLNPSQLIELFEIDISDILFGERLQKVLQYGATGQSIGLNLESPQYNIFRFHNNIKLKSTSIFWQGNEYRALPITITGFETSSKGTAATPKMQLSVIDDSIPSLKILKSLMIDLEDLVGAKVTRFRTFAKFLDRRNYYDDQGNALYNDIPAPFNPNRGSDEEKIDSNAYFSPDVYFVDKKSQETNSSIQLELASFINFEELKIPQRILNATRCPWTYRGTGCNYEYRERFNPDVHGGSEKNDNVNKLNLPKAAPPIATHLDEVFGQGGNTALIPNYDPVKNPASIQPKEWLPQTEYKANSGWVYITVKGINYYFFPRIDVPKNIPPPNPTYWFSDQCSKTIKGCTIRWGYDPRSKVYQPGANPSSSIEGREGWLPFGGYPGVRRRG